MFGRSRREPSAVADISPDQDIHVLGCAWMAMESQRVSTHENKLRACIGQLKQ
jgi:hypothetical protein